MLASAIDHITFSKMVPFINKRYSQYFVNWYKLFVSSYSFFLSVKF
jgi:hypothetical protein